MTMLEFVTDAIKEAKECSENYKQECYGLISTLPYKADEGEPVQDAYCLLMCMKTKDKKDRRKNGIACGGHAFLDNDFQDFIPLLELFAREQIELVVDVKGNSFQCGTAELREKLVKLL